MRMNSGASDGLLGRCGLRLSYGRGVIALRLLVCAAVVFFAGLATAAPAAGPNGETIFAGKCLLCHGTGLRAPDLDQLRKLSAEHIYDVLKNGAMQQQAASLSDADKHAVAEYVGSQQKVQPPGDLNPCKTKSASISSSGSWLGWSPDERNTRYQPAASAGLSARDVPGLELKWAFVFPGLNTAGNQPTVVNGRLYTGSWDGTIYALDAATGCSYWTYKAEAGVRTPIVITGGIGIFGDFKANVYAIDLATAKLLWKTKVDDHPEARITASPVLWQDRVYVPVASLEEGAAEDPKYPCCTFRGSVVALKIADGSQAWKSYTIDEPAHSTGKNKEGTLQFGPAGGSVWSSPTIDAKRHLVYVTDGNAYTSPEPLTTEAVAALEMDSGKRRWVKQLHSQDAWNGACMKGQNTANCPATEGPDFDFGAAPALATLADGRDLILAGQKSGIFYALNPENGDLVWKIVLGHGGIYGGIEWGFSVDERYAYVPISDRDVGSLEADGSMNGIDLVSGQRVWRAPAPPDSCKQHPDLCSIAQAAATTLIPGVVFSGSFDGHLRAYDTASGKIVWDYETDRSYDGINHVQGHGGSIGSSGPTIVNGMVYQTTGYASYGLGMPGNVLLAFGPANTSGDSQKKTKQ
jgi:polyvinyl alcohol dehydrogenase (cytochrome)